MWSKAILLQYPTLYYPLLRQDICVNSYDHILSRDYFVSECSANDGSSSGGGDSGRNIEVWLASLKIDSPPNVDGTLELLPDDPGRFVGGLLSPRAIAYEWNDWSRCKGSGELPLSSPSS
jgi:hypothetical protein